jgi:hypothetical protein
VFDDLGFRPPEKKNRALAGVGALPAKIGSPSFSGRDCLTISGTMNDE